MAKGKYLTKEMDEAVAKDYVSGLLSLDQIAKKHNIGRRTIYNCVDRTVPRYSVKKATNLEVVRLTRNEIELIFLLILCSDDIVPDEEKPILHTLEEKLYAAVDRDEESKRS